MMIFRSGHPETELFESAPTRLIFREAVYTAQYQ